MRKTMAIASREYSAAVKTKAFVISMVLLPLMMFGGLIMKRATQNINDIRDKTYAVIDRTPGSLMWVQLSYALGLRNSVTIYDKQTHKQVEPKFILENVAPSPADAESIEKQRFELSERVRSGELAGFLEIGPDVLQVLSFEETRDAPEESAIRYQSNTPTDTEFRAWADQMINKAVKQRRLEDAGVPGEKLTGLLQQVPLIDKGLTRRTASGKIEEVSAQSPAIAILVPIGLAMLMFLIVVVSAIPMMQGVLEEKQQRIAEVLLASVRPFQLMAGKLLGMVAVSMTMVLVYLAGAYFTANQMGFAQYVSVPTLIWFGGLAVLSVLMFGSLYIAVGASCTDLKEAQALLLPVNLVVAFPMMVLPQVIQHPNGPLAKIVTWIPPATPMITVARLAVPPGMPTIEAIGAVVLLLVTTAVLVWASGRIFRVGIMLQGKGASFPEMLRWIVTG